MSFWRLALGGARHYWRTNLGIVLGVALATTVLVGALLVGDSVRETLRKIALERVGSVDEIVFTQDRFFAQDLAQRIESQLDDRATVESAVFLRGSVSLPGGEARANDVRVIGVADDSELFGFAREITEKSAFLNERLSAQLGVESGAPLVLRVEKPGDVARDAPLSGPDDSTVALRIKATGVAGRDEGGNFALEAGQVPPFTIFVLASELGEALDQPGRANLLLATLGSNGNKAKPAQARDELQRAMADAWTLDDLGLELRPFKPLADQIELRSRRIFIEPETEQKLKPESAALTYFVNTLRRVAVEPAAPDQADRATPYSMVAAVDPKLVGFLPAGFSENDIAINQWLADDLAAGVGDTIELSYFVLGVNRKLVEQSAQFRVAAVLPMEGGAIAREWMPPFPGISDSEDCSDWDPGVPVDLDRIRDKDEAYWDDHRGAPKAFISSQAGRKLWANRFGRSTSLFFSGEDVEAREKAVRSRLQPEATLLVWEPFRERALAATNAPVDFGGLFIALSFFLVSAALILIGLLFVFAVQQRRAQAGLLLAAGWRPSAVSRLFLVEGAVLALAGVALGLLGAWAYVHLVLLGLETVWSGAVGSVQFVAHASMASLLGGGVAALLVSLLAMWWATRGQAKLPTLDLLSNRSGQSVGCPHTGRSSWLMPCAASLIILAVVLVACGLLGVVGASGPAQAGLFFGAGALLLTAGGLLCRRWLSSVAWSATEALPASPESTVPTRAALALTNTGRAGGRALAVALVMACGVFLVVAVGAFRHFGSGEIGERSSGTGGFALVGESSVPVFQDLNSSEGRESLALSEKVLADVSFVPMRVSRGDDASCLNLNRALRPRLLGVDPQQLAERGAFSIASSLPLSDAQGNRLAGWSLLDARQHDGDPIIPAIIDQNTAMWALGVGLGDTITCTDGQNRTFDVTVVGLVTSSLLQGNVLISEDAFVEQFSDSAGYSYFLIDVPADEVGAVSRELSRGLRDRGFQVTPGWRRFAEFKEVENTYISIFQLLGGLGLILGSMGLGIVAARNVLERRGELSLLRAVGWREANLRELLWVEHRGLLLWGLMVGAISAIVAVLPTLLQRLDLWTLANLVLLASAVFVFGLFSLWLAVVLALRGLNSQAIRDE